MSIWPNLEGSRNGGTHTRVSWIFIAMRLSQSFINRLLRTKEVNLDIIIVTWIDIFTWSQSWESLFVVDHLWSSQKYNRVLFLRSKVEIKGNKTIRSEGMNNGRDFLFYSKRRENTFILFFFVYFLLLIFYFVFQRLLLFRSQCVILQLQFQLFQFSYAHEKEENPPNIRLVVLVST